MKIPNIRFLHSVKASTMITLDSAEGKNETGNMMADMILYKFISLIFDVNILD